MAALKPSLTMDTLLAARDLLMNNAKNPVVAEEEVSETLPCPLCNKPMQEGRAGMWLHYLEEGCDYVAALRRIQKFFSPKFVI